MTTEGKSRSLWRSRLGLYAPVGLLLFLVVGWSVAWFVIRERVGSGLDEWISQEAAANRRWTCVDRTIGGYPFRIEIRCADFTVDRPDVHASIGKLLVVAQVYRPRHVIAEASGPLRIKAATTEAEGRWKLLRASVITADDGLELVSVVADDPFVSIQDESGTALDVSSRRFEGHLRPRPGATGTMDLAMRSEASVIPGLNELMGGTEPADTSATLSVSQTDDLPARPLWGELERWRAAGGRVELTALSALKAGRRLEGKGSFGIDAAHRPEGQLDLSGAGLGGMLGQLAGGGSLLGVLLGGGRNPDEGRANAPLKPLPPLRIQNGRLLIGPVPIPGFRVPALY